MRSKIHLKIIISVVMVCICLQACKSNQVLRPGRLTYLTDNGGGYALMIETNNGLFESFPRDDIGHYSWSPDGKLLAFESFCDPDLVDIYVINSDGSGEKNITKNSGDHNMNPLWSPNGKKILFTSARTGSTEIFVMNIDGSDPIQLTNKIGNIGYPNWSPDSKYIIFSAGRGGWYKEGENMVFYSNLYEQLGIYRVKLDGSELNKLVYEGVMPKWSPDGKFIIYESTKSNTGGIFRMKPDGSEIIKLVDNGLDYSWSPDGKKIAFSKEISKGNWNIFSMNYDGTDQINLSQIPGKDGNPVWSLDGKKIAFVSWREGDAPSAYLTGEGSNSEIYEINSDGTGQKRITDNGYANIYPNWKP